MRKFASTFAVLVVLGFTSAYADEAKPFIDNTVIDLTTILPPPPPNDSPMTLAELGEVLTIQVTRTPEMVARAQADDEEVVWRFGDVLGPKFSADTLPKTAAFFERVAATEGAVVDPAKKIFGRSRPHQMSDLVKPVVEPSKSAGWPSGHATLGTLMGILLADMMPEKRSAIMTRAWEYGDNRVVAGIHFPSDVDMGRISGSVIAFELMQRDDFKAEYDAVKAEIRGAFGLGS